jgi:biotin operon repressor
MRGSGVRIPSAAPLDLSIFFGVAHALAISAACVPFSCTLLRMTPCNYAWQNDYCYPGQKRLTEDMGLHETNVRKHLKSIEAAGLLSITRRGQGKTNIYALNLKPRKL